MAQDGAKDKLVDLLDREAFQPVLNASPDRYDTDSERRKLEDVQGATRREQHRYREEYTSARDVCDNFQDDLTSDEAREVERDLRALNLPVLRDVEGKFNDMCRDLGVD